MIVVRNRLIWLRTALFLRPDDFVVATLCSLTGLPVAMLAVPLAVSLLMTASSHEWVLLAFALLGIGGLSVYASVRPWLDLGDIVSRATRGGVHDGR